MLVKRTSKNQFTLPKAILKLAGVSDKDQYFDAEYNASQHVIYLRPVRVVIEKKIPDSVVAKFEEEALRFEKGDKRFKSRKVADRYLASKLKK